MASHRSAASSPGQPWPFGASFVDDGVNFAVCSRHAEAIELCLFDGTGGHETARLVLPERTGDVLHGFFPGLKAGQIYGLRAHGCWDPARGLRFNPNRLLLDPYTRELVGRFVWDGPNLVEPSDPFAFDPRDSAAFVPKGVVLQPTAATPPGPGTAWERTVLYELHVKGMTRLHPGLPEPHRGTYLGLAHPAVIEHLVRLGVTAVELLPVASFLDERRLVERGLVNYWGYNPYAFFVPERRYALHDPQAEFRAMVEALHAAGLEVILDVVFNHTAESDELGPTISFRGLDNPVYYRLREDDPRLYVDWAGCGNTLNTAEPRVLQLVLDVLRHWAGLGVDGFRFDLAAILGRDRAGHFDGDAAFLQALRQDPILGGRKLVAEPWDIGPEGYRLGGFPAPFTEWNDRFRDCVRRFWRGDEGVLPELAGRLLGSAELFEAGRRKSFASVNFVAAHDGFTLADTVAYGQRHNEANGEGNRDGQGENFSANYGVEGPSEVPALLDLRAQQVRNMLATLLLAQGTPMLAMGDEVMRSQAGNNNVYCQDGPTSWHPWTMAPGAEAMTAFVMRLTELRRDHPILRRRNFLHGRTTDEDGVADVLWLAPSGGPMLEADWREPGNQRFMLLLNGGAGGQPEAVGSAPTDDALLLLFNAAAEPARFTLPQLPGIARLTLELDTARLGRAGESEAGGMVVAAVGRSLLVYRGIREGADE